MNTLYRIETPRTPQEEKAFTELGLTHMKLLPSTPLVSLEGERLTYQQLTERVAGKENERIYYLATENEVIGSYEYSTLQESKDLLNKACYVWTEGLQDWKKLDYFPELQVILGEYRTTTSANGIPSLPPPIPSQNRSFQSQGHFSNYPRKKTLWQHFVYCLKNYTTFEGRASRSEYWSFVLFVFLGAIILDLLIGEESYSWNVLQWMKLDGDLLPNIFMPTVVWPMSLYSLFFFLPMLSVTSRRLHDSGKSSWFLLLFLVPIGGSIAIFVMMLLASNPTENKYGPVPTNQVETTRS